MVFHFRDEIKKRLMKVIGKLADYQVFFIAAYWFDKNVINETDMRAIIAAIDAAEIAEQGKNQYEWFGELEPDVTYDGLCDWEGFPGVTRLR